MIQYAFGTDNRVFIVFVHPPIASPTVDLFDEIVEFSITQYPEERLEYVTATVNRWRKIERVHYMHVPEIHCVCRRLPA